EPHGLAPVRGLRDDLDILCCAEERGDAVAHHRLVVGDYHGDRHQATLLPGPGAPQGLPPRSARPRPVPPAPIGAAVVPHGRRTGRCFAPGAVAALRVALPSLDPGRSRSPAPLT